MKQSEAYQVSVKVFFASVLAISIAAISACTSTATNPEGNETTEMQETGSQHVNSAAIGRVQWETVPVDLKTISDVQNWFKNQKKNVLVYWGAVWCPPCNELKSQVFSRDAFSDLTAGVKRIFVDGDAQNAQLISEALGVSGYPTLVVLDQNGKESARVSETVSFEEFKEIFVAATSQPRPFADRIQAALAGNASAEDWRVLALSRFELDKIGLAKSPEEDTRLLLNLYAAAPESKPKEKLQFLWNAVETASSMGGVLEIAASKDTDPKTQQRREINLEIAQSLAKELPKVLRSMEISLAARAFLNSHWKTAHAYLSLLPTMQTQGVLTEWLKTAEAMSQNPSLSIDTRLWTLYPRIQAEEVAGGKEVVYSKELRDMIKSRVQLAIAELETPYEHKAVVTGAAYLLQTVGEFEAAADLLLTELKETDTPYYVYSSLASLESARKNDKKALEYSSLAKAQSTGRATKFQWMTSEILLGLKLKQKLSDVRPLLKDAYATLFELDDGFRGRNYTRVQSIERELKKQGSLEELRGLVAEYQTKCQSLDKESAMRCTTHFLELSKLK